MSRYCLEKGKWYSIECTRCQQRAIFPHFSNANTFVRCASCMGLLDLLSPERKPLTEAEFAGEEVRTDEAHPVIVSSTYVVEVPPPDGATQLRALIDHEVQEDALKKPGSGFRSRLRRKIEMQLKSWWCTRQFCGLAEKRFIGPETNRVSFVRLFEAPTFRNPFFLPAVTTLSAGATSATTWSHRLSSSRTRRLRGVVLAPDAACACVPLMLFLVVPVLVAFLWWFKFTTYHNWLPSTGHVVHPPATPPSASTVWALWAMGVLTCCLAVLDMFRAVTTDPGYVAYTSELTKPFVHDASGEDKERSSAESPTSAGRQSAGPAHGTSEVIKHSTVTVDLPLNADDRSVVGTHSTNDVDPARGQDPAPFKKIDLDGVQVTVYYCEECQHYRPVRAFHCHQCGLCVHEWDHHCSIIGACVGKGNYRFFVHFLIFTLVAALDFSSLLFSLILLPLPHVMYLFAISLLSVTGLAAITVGGMLLAATINISCGLTQKERSWRLSRRMGRRRSGGPSAAGRGPTEPTSHTADGSGSVRREALDEPDHVVNPFNEGCWRNWKRFWFPTET